jgi:hypothetical protein
MSETLWQSRFQLLRQLGIAALVGLFIALPCIFVTNQVVFAGLLVAVMLLVLPGMVYLVLVTMWHWKQRYRGRHSDLWGGLILLETSGWFKLVYLFRHIIPDARGTGRYSKPIVASKIDNDSGIR